MHLPRLIIAASALLLLSSHASSDSVVVFNEIMYHPASAEEPEWIELHNQMSVDIDLSRWRLEGGTAFAFPEGTIIPGGGYLVIASDPAAFAEALGPLNGRLDNGGDRLRLMSASGRLMNEVRYNDRGAWPIAPDGSGASLALVNRDSAAPDASNWSWSTQPGGTPGTVNFPDDQLPARTLRINEVGPAAEVGFWVEIHNSGESAVDLEGHVLSLPSTDTEHTFDSVTLDSGAFMVIGSDQVALSAADGDSVYLYDTGKQTILDAAEIDDQTYARFPDGSDPWYRTISATPGSSNEVSLISDIVINEIFYHHRPQYPDPDQNVPFEKIDKEWIELYHRGDTPIDLTDWQLDGDISYDFPEGTMLAPGGYLVIDNGAAGFSGNLSNRSGHIVLEDAWGNPADEVRYYDDGDWPIEADGGGSSLELRNPNADNANAASWAASDESARTSWQQISYRGVAERSAVGPDNQWKELVIGILDCGEILIDDINVTEDPDGAKTRLISNSNFMTSIFGGTALRNWRPRGNHRHSEIVPDPDDPDNNVLRIVATGSTAHMHNHIETTFAGGASIINGNTYEISFRARALSGSPQLLTRLYFNRLPKTHILQTPDGGGTPGSVNSRLEPTIGPSLSHLSHSPAVPAVDEACVINVQAADPDGVAGLKLFWSVNGEAFTETPMLPSGTGHYSASIPPQEAGAIVQFYVEAEDTQGARSHMPAKAEQSRALYQVQDDRGSDPVLNHFRIIMRPDDADWMHEAINLMSDDRIPATVLYKEKETFYNVGVRLKGSERGRVTNQRIGFNVKFPTQQLFRGIHRTVAIDRSEGVGTGQFEILFNQMMTHSGAIPAEYNDLIHVISPRAAHTGPAELQLARYGSIFLDSQFDNGSDSNLYEYELIYYPTTDDANGYKRPSPDNVDRGGTIRDLGDDKENYRWTYLLKNNRDRDDFSSIMRYAKLFSKSDAEFQAELESVVDVDGWLQGMALALLTGAGDQYGDNSGHNGMFYEKPDGRITFFPHDVDFAFQATRSITQNTELSDIIKNPAYKRIYLAHLNNILTTTFNESYMSRWAEHFGELLPGQNFTSHLSYVASRSNSVKSQVGRMAPNATFGITSNDGKDFEVDSLSIEIEGTGGLDVYRLLHVEADLELTPEWTGLDTWKVVVPLEPGVANAITLQGLDVKGTKGSIFSPVGNDSITITSTAESPTMGTGDLVSNMRVSFNAGAMPIVTYERSRDEGLSFILEESADLITWEENTDATTTTEVIDDDREQAKITFAGAIDTPSHYVRLKIEQN